MERYFPSTATDLKTNPFLPCEQWFLQRTLCYERERNHCEQPFAVPSSMRVHMTRRHLSVKLAPSQISVQTKRTTLFRNRLTIRQQEDISCFPLEYEDEKENLLPGYTASAPQKVIFASCHSAMRMNYCTRLQNKIFKTYFLHQYLSYGNV